MQVLAVQLPLVLRDVLADGAPHLPAHLLKEDSVLLGPQEMTVEMIKMKFRTQKNPPVFSSQLKALCFFG